MSPNTNDADPGGPGGQALVALTFPPVSHHREDQIMTATTDNALHLTVDIMLLAQVDDAPHVLLIRRSDDSNAYPGSWALPGGYVDPGERVEDAARRELAEETDVTAPTQWQQVGIYDAPNRDPRGRVVSVAYLAVLSELVACTAGDDAKDAGWLPLADALTGAFDLAFDHAEVLADAVTCAYGVSSQQYGPVSSYHND